MAFTRSIKSLIAPLCDRASLESRPSCPRPGLAIRSAPGSGSKRATRRHTHPRRMGLRGRTGLPTHGSFE